MVVLITELEVAHHHRDFRTSGDEDEEHHVQEPEHVVDLISTQHDRKEDAPRKHKVDVFGRTHRTVGFDSSLFLCYGILHSLETEVLVTDNHSSATK